MENNEKQVIIAYKNSYGEEVKPIEPIRKENKTGRNEPCPCGSGKKYKRCCLNRKS